MDKGTTFKVLDHGYVTYIDSMGTDESIVEAARMSTGKGFVSWDNYKRCKKCGFVAPVEMDQCRYWDPFVDGGKACRSTEFEPPTNDGNLLEFLYSNEHMTPFEMCELAIEVQAPIAVFREWHRHRTQSYNEFSARYAQMPNLHYVPELGRYQKQAIANKQSSAEAFDQDIARAWQQRMVDEQQLVYTNYDEMVKAGLAKEVARFDTPISRYSKMRAKTDLRNWLGMLLLRKKPNAMYELRMYADVVGDIIKDLYPRTWALFEEFTFYAQKLSRSEMQIMKAFVEGQADKLYQIATSSGMDDKHAKALVKKFA